MASPRALSEKRTLHYTSKRIENSLRSKVFGGDKVDKVLLPSFLLQAIRLHSRRMRDNGTTYILEDIPDSRVCLFKIRSQELE